MVYEKSLLSKKGITLVLLIAAISIMMILITSAAVIGSDAIITANYSEYQSTLNRVSNSVNKFYLDNGVLPVTNETVAPDSLGAGFYTEVVKNIDSKNKLYVVDMNSINDSTIKFGYGTVLNKDVFLVAEKTQNIYYVKGFRYKGQDIFTIK